jgi:hypothetical protein
MGRSSARPLERRQFRTVLKMTGRIVRVDNLVTEAVDRLRSAGVKLKRCLSNRELAGIERSLGFTFNPEHRRLLALVLPTGESWPDWRHASTDHLRLRFDWPVDGVIFDVQNAAATCIAKPSSVLWIPSVARYRQARYWSNQTRCGKGLLPAKG